MTTITITDEPARPTAAVRAQVPMTALTEFFSHAFSETLEALRAQGVQPTGAPFAKYYGEPGVTVDVEAGFPVATTVTATGNVKPGDLPAGRVAEAIHVGPYDTLPDTYDELSRYFADKKITPAALMWENYLTDPETEPDPANWQTQICWPIG